jgi:hypothetical protein
MHMQLQDVLLSYEVDFFAKRRHSGGVEDLAQKIMAGGSDIVYSIVERMHIKAKWWWPVTAKQRNTC